MGNRVRGLIASITPQRGLKHIDSIVQHITFAHLRWAYTDNPHGSLPNIIDVHPTDIKWKSTLPRHVFPTKDSVVEREDVPYWRPIVGVIGGLWDLHRRGWNESSHHRSLERRFLDEVPWEQTALYRTNVSKIRRGETGQSAARTIAELDCRCADLDRLFQSMQTHGYLSEAELIEDPTLNRLTHAEPSLVHILGRTYPSECRVGIGRRGEIIRFSAGRHRVSLAKILGIESIPVILVVRHKSWDRIRTSFAEADTLTDIRPHHRKFATHPDIQFHASAAGDPSHL